MHLIPKSLSFRVLVYVFATTFVMLMLLGGIIFSEITTFTKSVSQERLLGQARQISSFIEYDWRGRLDVDLPSSYREYYAGESNHHQYGVMDSSGKILFQSKDFLANKIKNTKDKGPKHYFSFESDNGKYFSGLKYDYLFEDKIYPVYVIEYEEEFSAFIETLRGNFIQNIILLMLPLLLLQGLLISLIFRAAFKPVLKASKEVRKIKYDNLSFRLNEDNVHSELLPLIKGVNNSLSRLEKSAETQKFFIANAAHELRTPLAILKARIASLKNEKEIYVLNEDLRNINRLISQMLDISRMDSIQDIPKTQININEVTQKACADIGPLFVAQNRELSLEQRNHDLTINGNEDTLFRAILNLLENALKHTPNDTSVRVIIEGRRLIIRDYGPPIPDEHKIKLFERFEKLPENTNTKGSGLGLSIVKKAAEIHNGTISIVSRKDGNDFILDLG